MTRGTTKAEGGVLQVLRDLRKKRKRSAASGISESLTWTFTVSAQASDTHRCLRAPPAKIKI